MRPSIFLITSAFFLRASSRSAWRRIISLCSVSRNVFIFVPLEGGLYGRFGACRQQKTECQLMELSRLSRTLSNWVILLHNSGVQPRRP